MPGDIEFQYPTCALLRRPLLAPLADMPTLPPMSYLGVQMDIILHREGLFMSTRPNVPIPKFAQACGLLGCELRNQRDISKSMILVPPLDLKFFTELAASSEELQIRGTSVVRPPKLATAT
jgi:hypothetical protein